MRFQDKIYIQSQAATVYKNSSVSNVGTSSDFCVFKSPTYEITGTTKVQCSDIKCDLSGYSSDTLFTAATNNCFISQSMDIGCFSSATWTTKIYEDNVLSYSKNYYTSTSTGDTPTTFTFLNSIQSGLNKLNYYYTYSGTVFTIKKPKTNVKELKFDVSIDFGIKPTNYVCPAGYTATPYNDACQKITSSAVTDNGAGATTYGDTDSSYSSYGTYFYPSIQNYSSLPVYYTGDSSNLINQTGGTISPVTVVSSGNSFWANETLLKAYGRLNNTSLEVNSTEWLGFSKCINITLSLIHI